MILHKTIICNLGEKNLKSLKAFSPHIFFCLLKIFCFLIFKKPFHTLLGFFLLSRMIHNSILYYLQASGYISGYRVNTAGKSIFLRVQAGVAVEVLVEFYQQQY